MIGIAQMDLTEIVLVGTLEAQMADPIVDRRRMRISHDEPG